MPGRNPIQKLSQSLVNRIAAGEVIERPASVVKELVENSIDAGARRIVVEIRDGGRELIRVTDDGCGIPANELPLAFAPHATSKLATDEDLFRIGTLGFRGEALASIGSVSHARILSRPPEEPFAHEITNHGGVIGTPQSAAGNPGTTIEIRNLFFNVPARRKFLKGQATEFGHISEAVLRIALAHPVTGFELIHDGRLVLNLSPTSEMERWKAAWPGEFADQLLAIDAEDAEIRLRGIVGLPALARPTAKYQQLFLNGRSIRDKFIQHALREAYRGLTEPGRYPAAVLLLEMPPGDVDVNVHPAKTEVRFRDSQRIHGLVLASIRERLLGSDLSPQAEPAADRPGADREALRERLAAFFRDSSGFKTGPADASDGSQSGFPAGEAGGFRDSRSDRTGFRPGSLSKRLEGPAGPAFNPEPSPRAPNRAPLAQTELDNAGYLPGSAAAPVSRAIQLHNTYLVAESEDGLLIIDQHALHERIMFEELLARVRRGPLESQRLLIPVMVDVSEVQVTLLPGLESLLSRLGVELAQIGPRSVAVHAFPSFLERLDPGEFVRDLLEQAEQDQPGLNDEQLLHEVLDMMACKSAVRAGDALSAEQVAALLDRKDMIERSSNCPHGRPTMLRLTLRDLEKQFKRTGF